MPKLKREIFMRPNRMTHRFGDQDDARVMPDEYFDLKIPVSPKAGSAAKRFGVHEHGLKVHTPPQSPISKARGGHAAFGKTPDKADTAAETVPPSTRERRTSGPLSESVTEVKRRKGGNSRG